MGGCQTLSNKEDSSQEDQHELVETKLSLIMTHLEQREEEKSIRELRTLLIESPDDYRVLAVAGIVYLFFSKPKLAISYLEKAYGLHSTTDIGLNLSAGYLADHQNEAAQKILEVLLQDPSYDSRERIYHNLGLTFEQKRDFQMAENQYQKALMENPTYYVSHFRLGLLYQKQHKRELAIESFTAAIKFCPNCYEPIEAVSGIYMEAGEVDKVVTLVSRFLEQKDPGSQAQIQAQSLLEKATALQKTLGVSTQSQSKSVSDSL